MAAGGSIVGREIRRSAGLFQRRADIDGQLAHAFDLAFKLVACHRGGDA
jgi:hypothetical protein